MFSEEKKDLKAHAKTCVSIKYNSTGSMIASASADKKSHIYCTKTGDLLTVLDGEHNLGLNDCAWIDDRLLATASDDKLIKVWDIETGKAITTLHGNKSFVYCLAVDPDTKMILSGGYDGTIRLHHPATGDCVMNFDANAGAVTSVEFSPSFGTGGSIGGGQQLQRDFVSGSHDGLVRVWDYAHNAACKTSFHVEMNHSPPISCVRYTPNGQYLLVSTLDNQLRLFSADTDSNKDPNVYESLRTYEGHKNESYTIQTAMFFSGSDSVDGADNTDNTDYNGNNVNNGNNGSSSGNGDNSHNYVISGSEDGGVCLWDIDDTEMKQTLEGHTNAVLAVACNPDREAAQIASAGKDMKVKLWSTKTEGEEKE